MAEGIGRSRVDQVISKEKLTLLVLGSSFMKQSDFTTNNAAYSPPEFEIAKKVGLLTLDQLVETITKCDTKNLFYDSSLSAAVYLNNKIKITP